MSYKCPLILTFAASTFVSATAFGAARALIPNLPSKPTVVDSTVPANGDVNPYGVAFVPAGFPAGGLLRPGNVLVANFNNSANLQGTGTTIVRVNPDASPSLFFSDPSALGFSTALGVLKAGFVLVGNLPSTNASGVCTEGSAGQEENVGRGALLVINRRGQLVKTIKDAKFLDGPWDLTIADYGSTAIVFVSNALSGTVTRLDLGVGDDDVVVESKTEIASGYAHRCDPAAFVVGPTGVALDAKHDVLYVASAGDNEIFAVPNATFAFRSFGRGFVVVKDPLHLHGPLGLALASDGDLISAQGDAVNPDPNQPSEIVEFTPGGKFVGEFSIPGLEVPASTAQGAAFGLAVERTGSGSTFAAVDDNLNVLDVWNVP